MTPTQIELMTSVDFWQKRHAEQMAYIKSLLHHVSYRQKNIDRILELRTSAFEMLGIIRHHLLILTESK